MKRFHKIIRVNVGDGGGVLPVSSHALSVFHLTGNELHLYTLPVAEIALCVSSVFLGRRAEGLEAAKVAERPT